MRIAVLNWTRRKAGGVESYLSSVIPELARRGHDLAFWYETDKPLNREPISFPAGVPVWSVAELGVESALQKLKQWQPELIYAHGLLNPDLEVATIGIAPAIFFTHSYYGTCISGAKTFRNPSVKPCDRRFGLACLLNYYPRRCGGLNPVTMLTEYRRQSRRLDLLSRYKAIVTHSTHMRAEYIKHGLAPERVHELLYYVRHSKLTDDLMDSFAQPEPDAGAAADRSASDREEWRLLFLGRMDYLKGGSVFLDALPKIGASVKPRLHVTFAGDGPSRARWEAKAAKVEAKNPRIKINFTGWCQGEQLEALMTNSDLLVIPSLWPEPFGLVGTEAGLYGIPAVAFAVGGIPNWLSDGVNGCLAAGDPPTADKLSRAVVKCLTEPGLYPRLRRGAKIQARRFQMDNHLVALMKVFESVLSASCENSVAAVN